MPRRAAAPAPSTDHPVAPLDVAAGRTTARPAPAHGSRRAGRPTRRPCAATPRPPRSHRARANAGPRPRRRPRCRPAPPAAAPRSSASRSSTSHGIVTAGSIRPLTSDVTGSTTTPVASSASNVPTIWLPAVCEMPRVATSARDAEHRAEHRQRRAGGPRHDPGDGLGRAGRAATRVSAGRRPTGGGRRLMPHDRTSRPSTMPTHRVARAGDGRDRG